MAMQFEAASFAPRREVPPLEERYEGACARLGHDVVHGDMTLKQLRRRVEMAKEDTGIREQEKEAHGLEAIERLFQGMEAHDSANEAYLGVWQETLAEANGNGKTLSREEVRALFEDFPLREDLLQAEAEALAQYEALLARSEVRIRVSEHVWIDRTDIEGLVNDLRVRQAERVASDTARTEQLDALDEELAALIERVPREERGQRLELQEIYVLRRLVHAADTGHVVTVEHGTLREDFRGDRGKVDLHVAVAGQDLAFQVKTFQARVSSETVRQQERAHTRATQQIAGTGTHLVVLQAEAVREVYERARRAKGRPVSLEDKYEALQPLTDVLSPAERERLLALTGMTEENFQEERERFEANYKAIQEHQATYFLREAERLQTFQERERELQEERRAEEEKERAKQQAIERRKAEQARVAEERIRERAEAVAAKQRMAEERTQEGLIEAERRRKEALRRAAEEAANAAKREAQRKKRLEKESLGWPPKNFLGMLNPPLLQRLELLPSDWSNNPQQLLAAKKEFLQLFAKPKKGKSPTDNDAPNAFFKEVFRTAPDFESPNEDVLAHIHASPESKAA